MPTDILIARWVSIFWLICGFSHVIHPQKWADLLVPLRDRETGGLILAAMSLPIGLVIVIGHNVWTAGIPLIVTLAGWITTLKSTIYLLFPGAHSIVMGANRKRSKDLDIKGLRTIGIAMIVLGGLTAWDSFFAR